ncbi:MAG: UDP-galactopyranose mutase [Melioribacteraceae bacterium]|nr:UDP-galactopyranose mutase [Melioribacteraceae bacterium]
MKYDYLIIGTGFAGSVAAERLASQHNKKILLVEKRSHIGGNAYDALDEHGILIHKYGPHILHTNNKEVFEYLSQFTEWREYEHRVLANLNGKLYPIPINRTTINKLYSKNFTTDNEVKEFYESVREKRNPILNSEDIIVNQVGQDLYEKFFKHYTKKQWELDPSKLSPSVCGRIPIRTNTDDRYFTDKFQFMPKDGYTKMFEKMLEHKNIEILLNIDYKDIVNKIQFDKMIYTGPIDYFFDYKFGKLPYRSIKFKWENLNVEKHLKAASYNFVSSKKKYTRITEHKYLTGQKANSTTISKEFPQMNGDPFYPIPNNENSLLFNKYKKESDKLENVEFIGRLAEYKYYNMDQVVGRVLKNV